MAAGGIRLGQYRQPIQAGDLADGNGLAAGIGHIEEVQRQGMMMHQGDDLLPQVDFLRGHGRQQLFSQDRPRGPGTLGGVAGRTDAAVLLPRHQRLAHVVQQGRGEEHGPLFRGQPAP